MLYNNLSSYFREKYGRRLKKICIDGGFTCPNRDGSRGVGGCIFCGERGAGEHIDRMADTKGAACGSEGICSQVGAQGSADEGDKVVLSIGRQVRNGLAQAGEEDLFVAYFQNFTNTYAPIEVLRKRYDAALIDERIKVLAIGTRPDCIDEESAALIAEYGKSRDVWVELGLQTANDLTAELINRGYGRESFERAMDILRRHGIPVVVHLIIGLPGEGDGDIAETCEYLSAFDIWGVKIHSIYVMRGTRLAELWERGEYTPPDEEDYIRRACYLLTHLPESAVIHRLTGDCPAGLRLAPSWGKDKHELIETINARLAEGGLRQGCFYGKK